MYKLFYFILYILYASGFDSYFYGRGEKGKFKWLFKNITLFGISKPWRYRIIQKIWEVSGIVCVYLLSNPSPFGYSPFVKGRLLVVLPCLAAHYFMVLDRLYYVFNGQEKLLRDFEINHTDVWWLKNPWFSGKFFFAENSPINERGAGGFTVLKFNVSALIGLIISYLIILLF